MLRGGGATRLGRQTAARLTGAVAVGALVVLVSAVGASADRSIKDKRAQAQEIIGQIQVIDEEVGAAAERWNGANIELSSLTTQLAQTRRDVVRARALYKVAQRRAAERLRTLYVEGKSDSMLEVLLGARTLDDVVTRIDASQRIAQQDARIAREARVLRAEVIEREEQLAREQKKQIAVVEDLEAEKQAIEAKLAERKRLLSSVEDEIARLQAAEQRRQAELRSQAQLDLQRQARARAQATQATPTSSASAPASSDAFSGAEPASDDYTPPPADASKGAQVVAIAMQYLGVPYVWGGADPSVGFDCSGLTMYVYAQIGISLPHYAAAQYRMGVPVSKDQLQPGDLVFFRNLSHMGMYVGGGNFIQAPRTGDVVKISSLSEPYYVSTWVGARRVL